MSHSQLFELLECSCRHDAYFVDLFVRKSNDLAIQLYTKLGYTTYRTVLGYYSGKEDALGASLVCPCTELSLRIDN